MELSDNERSTIVRMEMEKARKTFADMEFCAKEQKWEAAANRLYYALFHAGLFEVFVNDCSTEFYAIPSKSKGTKSALGKNDKSKSFAEQNQSSKVRKI